MVLMIKKQVVTLKSQRRAKKRVCKYAPNGQEAKDICFKMSLCKRSVLPVSIFINGKLEYYILDITVLNGEMFAFCFCFTVEHSKF